MTYLYLSLLILVLISIIYQFYYRRALLRVQKEFDIELPSIIQLLISENLIFTVIILCIALIFMLIN